MAHTLPWAGASPLAPRAELRGLVIGLALLSAISAIGGGIALVVWRGGSPFLPLRMIEHTPFTSRYTAAAPRWIGYTALAWTIALPLSFAPGPFVDESTPIGSHLVLWACGGLLMAYVMALVTWQGARRLPERA